ncbi:3-oxoacyl-ACP reductase FabG [Kamptonema cortianum]|nr:3-oxoacyl-ACP reductase FabG [Geitlerinema splendidum]MDK3156916.1 3-oxoacyl-ACP reductase FabG [Kamptonema cortianum]
MRFQDQVVVVTGASRGIGQAIALRFGAEGAIVACIATKKENAQGTVDQIIAAGGRAEAFGLDVADSQSVEAVFTTISETLGSPSVLVNNAGITRDTLLMRMKDEDWQSVIDVNLKGSYNCIKAVMKGMMKARTGRIINISSVVGLHGAAGQVNYAASKAGLIGMTLAVAKELGSRNITCNAVAPGFISTDMTAELSEEMKNSAISNTPLGRLGEGEDIAGVVAFLASDDAAYVTGQTITVDGGLFL